MRVLVSLAVLAWPTLARADRPGPPLAPCTYSDSQIDHALPLETKGGQPIGQVFGQAQVGLTVQPGSSPVTAVSSGFHLEAVVPTAKLRLNLVAAVAFDAVTEVGVGTPVLFAPKEPGLVLIDPTVLVGYTPTTATSLPPQACGMAALHVGATRGGGPYGTLMRLKPAVVTLSDTPGGKPVGKLKRDKDGFVWVLGHSGKYAQVELWRGTVTFHGWIPASAIRAHLQGESDGSLAMLGAGDPAEPWTCPGKVDLHAGPSGPAAEPVGWIDPGSQFTAQGTSDGFTFIQPWWGLTFLDTPKVHLMVRTADLAACKQGDQR